MCYITSQCYIEERNESEEKKKTTPIFRTHFIKQSENFTLQCVLFLSFFLTALYTYGMSLYKNETCREIGKNKSL